MEGEEGSHTDQHQTQSSSSDKVDLLLKATGDDPIMKRKKWCISADQTVSWVITFIRQYLKLSQDDSLVSKLSPYIHTKLSFSSYLTVYLRESSIRSCS